MSPAVGPAPCATSGLRLTLGVSQGYAGGVYQTIVFTNTSGATCTLYGYPGVSLVSASPYTQIGLAAKRGGTTPVKLITLAPGASRQRPAADRGRAELPDRHLRPDQGGLPARLPAEPDRPVYLADTSEICAQPVQTLFISAVQAGSGSSS